MPITADMLPPFLIFFAARYIADDVQPTKRRRHTPLCAPPVCSITLFCQHRRMFIHAAFFIQRQCISREDATIPEVYQWKGT